MSRLNNRDERFNLIGGFNPYRIHLDNNEIFIKGIPYVFMTCPMINLSSENIMASDFLGYMIKSGGENKSIIEYLSGEPVSGSYGVNKSLIPLITNTALSVDIKDTAARTKEVGETFYGYKQVYPGSTVDSIVGDEISIKYLEQDNLPIIKLHKGWLEYIEGVRRGIFRPVEKAINDGYIDFLVSIYYFLTDFSGERIVYWAKYTGCGPLIVPYSSLGGDFSSHDIPDVTINYSYCHKADMDFAILRDFNKVSIKTRRGSNFANFNYKNLSNGKIIGESSVPQDSVVRKNENYRQYFVGNDANDISPYYASINHDFYSDKKSMYYTFYSPVVTMINGNPYLQWKRKHQGENNDDFNG